MPSVFIALTELVGTTYFVGVSMDKATYIRYLKNTQISEGLPVADAANRTVLGLVAQPPSIGSP